MMHGTGQPRWEVEMSKKSGFEGYFCSRKNQKSGSEGVGDVSVVC